MLGILLFLSSISIVPHFFFGVIFLYEICFRRKELLYNYTRNKQFFGGILIVVALCCINALAHGLQGLPSFIILPFTVLISFGIRRSDLKWFVWLLLFEICVGCYEQILGVSSILPTTEAVDFGSEELLYYRKAAGLSSGPGGFALKLLIGIMIIYIIGDEYKPLRRVIICGALYFGVILTFTRTVLLIAAAFIIIRLTVKYKHFIFHTAKGQVLISLLAIGVVWCVFQVADTILFQFARGNDSVDVSGRDEIWGLMFRFIKEHPLFGNGSIHYKVYYSGGSIIHAHNSFIQLLADHGVIISSIFLLLVLSKIKKGNIIYVFSIFLTSMAQYTIFWGYSVIDVFFYALLCNKLIGLSSINQNNQCRLNNECIQNSSVLVERG